MRPIGRRTGEGSGNLSGRIGVGAEADHDVEQDDGDAGVGQRRGAVCRCERRDRSSGAAARG